MAVQLATPFIFYFDDASILKNFLKFLFFFGIGAVILYFVYQNLDAAYQEDCILKNIPAEDCDLILKLWTDFLAADFFWLFIVLIAFTISNVSRALRWQQLIEPMGYQPRFLNSFFTIMLGYFANLGLPRMGEVIRIGTFSKYENIPAEKVTGAWVIDRTVDVLSFALVIGLAFLIEFDTLWNFMNAQQNATEGETGVSIFTILIWVASISLVIGGVIIGLFYKKILQSEFYKKMMNTAKGFLEGILSIRQLDRPWVFVFHSLNIWVMYFLMTWLGMFAFEPTANLGIQAGVVLFAAGSLGMIIPSPGGLGSYHAMVIGALLLYGVAKVDAGSFANILFFSLQIGCNVLLGVIALIVLPIYNKKQVTKGE